MKDLFNEAWISATASDEMEVSFMNAVVRLSNGKFDAKQAQEYFKEKYRLLSKV